MKKCVMRNRMVAVLAVALSVCALSLFAIAGCSSGSSSSSASSAGTESSASSSAESVESSAASAASESASAATSSASASTDAVESTSASATSASADSAASTAAAGASSEAASDSADAAQHFKGTVLVLNCSELLELQGSDLDPSMFNDTGTYAVLKLAEPTEVTGMIADGTGPDTRTANVLGIGEFTDYDSFTVEYGDMDQWKELEGQEIEISAVEEDIMFPTDVSLPINEPKINKCEIVN